ANVIANTVSVLLGSGNGTFGQHSDFNVGTSPRSVAVGDFNGDGKLDIVTNNSMGVAVLLGAGNGSLYPQTTFPAGVGPTCVTVADFNGDGKLDLAVSNAGSWDGFTWTGSSVSILLGNGNGTFQAPVNYPVG